ncbi:MAG: biotin--[acetyl-CoA-carboxylase] ligase, partial [Actinobacteria bacterium]|nr:biotin--[acetyl-CoA-carboxylase] ligase [Actinomycetota bacterium]
MEKVILSGSTMAIVSNLTENLESLKIDKFRNYLKTKWMGKKIILFSKIDSTNDFASSLERNIVLRKIKQRKIESIESILNSPQKLMQCFPQDILEKATPKSLNGVLILAETQTFGRGRFKRKWLSPQGGLWFTLILIPKLQTNNPETKLDTCAFGKNLPKITLIAAASITQVLEKEYKIKTLIKWPNDIYYKNSNKNLKLGGILAECEKIEKDLFLNLGIGLNVNLDINQLEE